MTKAEILRLAESIQGWCFREELEWLHDRAAELPEGGTWVEVGTWKGRSFCPVLFAAPATAHVIAVDNFKGHPLSPTVFEAQFPNWLKSHVGLLMDAAARYRKFGPLAELWEVESLDACKELGPHLDVVWLDRDYRDCFGIRNDIAEWAKSLKPGGMLCGRNHTISDAPFVTLAVDEMLPDHQRGPGSIWWWSKPR